LELDVIAMAIEKGWSKRRIADYLGIAEQIVRRYLIRNPVIANPEDFEIVVPQHLTPSSPPTPIREGDAAYCVVSHKTGIEDHPKLRRPPKRTKTKKEPAKFKPKGSKASA
jgi:hypothetical protein